MNLLLIMLIIIIMLLLLMLISLFYYIKYLLNVLMKSLNAINEVAIFIIILNLCYSEKIIYEINYIIIIIIIII